MDTKVVVQYRRQRCQNGKDSQGDIYKRELREEAVKLVTEGGLSIPGR